MQRKPLLDGCRGSRSCGLRPRGTGTGRSGLAYQPSGDATYESFFSRLSARHSGRVWFFAGYDESLAHWIEGASDLFLMPSLYEPCGLNQMYSLKYGTVPIVRRTGGLADSVQQWNPASRRGTGILFNDFDAAAVRWALHTAIDLFKDRTAWLQAMRNGMEQDFSWDRQSRQYVQLYETVIASAP